jgi:hypothetical protein
MEIIDRMQDRQGTIIESQQTLLATLLTGVVDAIDADQRGDGGPDADVRVVESVTSAHNALVATFQQHRPTPASAAASLEVVTRWQMTYAPYFRVSNGSLQCGDWTILACVFERFVYFLSVRGTDPASATVKYLAVMLTETPRSKRAWAALLEEGSAHLERFAPLPGDGIYDLATRLERHAIRD